MIPDDRVYLDPGDRLTRPYDPPRECAVFVQWGSHRPVDSLVQWYSNPSPGPWFGRPVAASGPRNVAVEYLATRREAVVPFTRRLRRTCDDCRGFGQVYDKASHLPVPCDRCQATGRYRRRQQEGGQ